jgi:hypothetical protein
MLKHKLRSLFVDDYYCDCYVRSHRRPMGIGFVGAYIGVAIGLINYHEVNKEVNLKGTCTLCS